MQLQFPIFPEHTRMINSSVGFYAHDGFVYYLHNVRPFFAIVRRIATAIVTSWPTWS